MGVKIKNNAFGVLLISINTSATSITLQTGQGANFPSLSAGDYFYATLIDTSNNLEIVKVTARTGDVLTVVRAQEGTTARSYAVGDRIELRLTAQNILDMLADGSLIGAGTVPGTALADLAVSTAKLADGAVTSAKIADLGIATGDLADAAVTAAKLASGAARTNFGAGAVLAVQQARKTDTWSVSSTSYTAVDGLSITMTPRDANSKFLIFVDLFVGAYWWGASGGYLGVSANGTTILGNGSAIWTLQYGADSGNSPYETQQWTDCALYSPGTTSAITFTAQLASYTTSYALYLNRSYNNYYGTQGRSTLTVLEIAG
jgi:hypothetical protein